MQVLISHKMKESPALIGTEGKIRKGFILKEFPESI